MAEVIASIIGISTFGIKLTLNLYEFGSTTASAKQQTSHIAKHVTLYSNVLELLAERLEADAPLISEAAIDLVEELYDQSDELFGRIRALLPRKEAGEDMTFLQKIAWNFKKTRVDLLVAELEYLKSTVQLLVTVIFVGKKMKSYRKHHGKVGNTKSQNEPDVLEFQILKAQTALVEQMNAADQLPSLQEEDNRSDHLALGNGSAQDTTKAVALIAEQIGAIAKFHQSLSLIKDASKRQSYVLQNSTHLLYELITQWTSVDASPSDVSPSDTEKDSSQQFSSNEITPDFVADSTSQQLPTRSEEHASSPQNDGVFNKINSTRTKNDSRSAALDEAAPGTSQFTQQDTANKTEPQDDSGRGDQAQPESVERCPRSGYIDQLLNECREGRHPPPLLAIFARCFGNRSLDRLTRLVGRYHSRTDGWTLAFASNQTQGHVWRHKSYKIALGTYYGSDNLTLDIGAAVSVSVYADGSESWTFPALWSFAPRSLVITEDGTEMWISRRRVTYTVDSSWRVLNYCIPTLEGEWIDVPPPQTFIDPFGSFVRELGANVHSVLSQAMTSYVDGPIPEIDPIDAQSKIFRKAEEALESRRRESVRRSKRDEEKKRKSKQKSTDESSDTPQDRKVPSRAHDQRVNGQDRFWVNKVRKWI